MKSDIGRFAIIPEWLLDSGVSANAIRLFAVLAAKYADRNSGDCFPTRATLAQDLGLKDVSTVYRLCRELEGAGALSITLRGGEKGESQESNVYTISYARPRCAEATAPLHESNTPLAHAQHRTRINYPESVNQLSSVTVVPEESARVSRAPRSQKAPIRLITPDELLRLASDYPEFDVGAELENCRGIRTWATTYVAEEGALRNRLRLRREDRRGRSLEGASNGRRISDPQTTASSGRFGPELRIG